MANQRHTAILTLRMMGFVVLQIPLRSRFVPLGSGLEMLASGANVDHWGSRLRLLSLYLTAQSMHSICGKLCYSAMPSVRRTHLSKLFPSTLNRPVGRMMEVRHRGNLNLRSFPKVVAAGWGMGRVVHGTTCQIVAQIGVWVQPI